MDSEVRVCQNCKNHFVIEADDFVFFENMQVPAPTFCPTCQFRSHLLFRNERSLYHRKDDHDGKDVISMYSQDKPLKVYARDYWWSDDWDPMEFGRDYDFSRPFFEQFKNLLVNIPHPSLFLWNSMNSDFCNFTTDAKNCYLVISGDFCENCFYSKYSFRSKDSGDLYWVEKAELSYGNVDCDNIYRVAFSSQAEGCTDSVFLHNCSNCSRCFGCVNLKNASYRIFNKQLSKEAYEAKIKEINISDHRNLERFKSEFEKFKLGFPKRFAQILKSIHCTGDNIFNSKNCKHAFDVHDESEDSKYIFMSGWGIKDAYISDHCGYNAQKIFNSIGVFSSAQRVMCSAYVPTCNDVSYSYNCKSSNNLFGCVGVRNGQYCILNKRYSAEEYKALIPKIRIHMEQMPYIDATGRKYSYGDFFPADLSLFGYNETEAYEHEPLAKEEAIGRGLRWKAPNAKEHLPTKEANELPDDITDVDDSILGEIIACAHKGTCNEQCTTAFRLIKSEIQLYRMLNLPLPRMCPNCRYYQLLKTRNQSYKLWTRKCDCGGNKSRNSIYENTTVHFHGGSACSNEFQTPHAEDGSEIVYCEQCYQAETA